MPLSEETFDNIRDMNLEEATEELHRIVRFVKQPIIHQWFEVYVNLVNDRRAYRELGMEQYYHGEKDGSMNEEVDAKLKLVSYYTVVQS